MTKVILLNGPPRCGKDTLGRILQEYYSDTSQTVSFASCLKVMVHGMLYPIMHGIHSAALGDPYYYEDIKDIPQDDLALVCGEKYNTYRKLYILLSEEFFKPKFGKEFFGKTLAEYISVQNEKNDTFIVTDCGFAEEVQCVVGKFGAENCQLIQLYRDGCTFANDSRSYINIPGIVPLRIENSRSIEDLRTWVRDFYPS